MKTSDFYYELPKELIAQTPIERRDGSRMMLVDRRTGETSHGMFRDFPSRLREGDCLILNDSRVIPARLMGERTSTGGEQKPVELLLLRERGGDVWECLARPGRKCRPGTRLRFGGGLLEAVVEEQADDGNKLVRFFYAGIFNEILDRLGQTPLPPYITEKLADQERYQTVYAKHRGSAAAPTAGLHFTPGILEDIGRLGVGIGYVTLHVGLGTFRPVQEDDVGKHVMHSEWYTIPGETQRLVAKTKASGGRVVAVGTTSCRTLESAYGEGGLLRAASGDTDIFIYPGYRFKIIDGLLTNFHLPESTLIMLVSAFAGRENILRAYEEAVRERYRFFSFGDCMFIS